MVSERGYVTEVIGTILDITEQKTAEDRLRDSERRFRQLVESIPHHVWSFRRDGSVGYWNQQLIDYTGLTPDELRQGGWAALHPGDTPRVKAAWGDAWSHEAPYEQEQRIRSRDGTYRRFICRGVPVRNEVNEVVEWFGTATDVEEHRRAEEAVQKAQAELARVARVTTLGELIAAIAHDINQPLAAVVANSGACIHWLSGAEPNLDEARRAAARTVTEGHRVSEVIARVRSLLTKRPAQLASVSLNNLIKEILELIRYEIVRHSVMLETELAADLPAIEGDAVQLQQVVLNLIINAVEATTGIPEGSRKVAVTTEGQGADLVVMTVRDSGAGIDASTTDAIFEPFFTTKVGGIGMGLSISRTIIEAHGGSLWLEKQKSPGATFRFSLPVHR